MIWTQIKNNCKLMLRNKLVIFLAIFGPLIVISALSSAFHDLLNTTYDKSEFVLGYSIDGESSFANNIDLFLSAMEKQDIICEKYSAELAQTVIKEGRADVFMEVGTDECTLYSLKTGSVETRICRYAINQFYQGITIQQIFMENPTESVNVTISEQKMESPKTASASDYYGIIEIVYFMI